MNLKLTLFSIFSRKRWAAILDKVCYFMIVADGPREDRIEKAIPYVQSLLAQVGLGAVSASAARFVVALAERRCRARLGKPTVVVEPAPEAPGAPADSEPKPSPLPVPAPPSAPVPAPAEPSAPSAPSLPEPDPENYYYPVVHKAAPWDRVVIDDKIYRMAHWELYAVTPFSGPPPTDGPEGRWQFVTTVTDLTIAAARARGERP